MTQLIINIEDKTILPHLKKILNAIDGISIVNKSTRRRPGIEEAYEDIKNGHINHYDSAESLFKSLGI